MGTSLWRATSACSATPAYAKELNHVGKLDDRSMPGVFIGYTEGIKTYRILDPMTQRVCISRDVVFDEGRD